MKKQTIGIVGVGMVGGALQRYFKSKKNLLKLYDKYKNIGSREEIAEADIVFFCVPTPFRKIKGFDDSFLLDAFSLLEKPCIVVIKSTVLPGSTDFFQKKFPQHKILFNPEFLVESSADHDMRHPDRQIIGYTEKSQSCAKKILQLLPRAPFEKIIPAEEAEMVKYFGNAFLATKVIFANEIYDLCEKLGIDYETVKKCASADQRIGSSHLDVFHGGYRGYGGKCLPKDMHALLHFSKKRGMKLPLLSAVEKINKKLFS